MVRSIRKMGRIIQSESHERMLAETVRIMPDQIVIANHLDYSSPASSDAAIRGSQVCSLRAILAVSSHEGALTFTSGDTGITH